MASNEKFLVKICKKDLKKWIYKSWQFKSDNVVPNDVKTCFYKCTIVSAVFNYYHKNNYFHREDFNLLLSDLSSIVNSFRKVSNFVYSDYENKMLESISSFLNYYVKGDKNSSLK